jgi:diacylglycerol kinase (ATP)
MVYPPPHLLLNPAAGRGRAGKRLQRILGHLRQAGINPVVHESNRAGDLESTARELAADDVTLLVAGGDGSVHELVNGLLAAGAQTPFGVIPAGTGNDFAKAAEIPLDWETATRLLAERVASATPPRRVDAGRMNDRYFANGAGIGFDGTVNRIARSYRRPMGDLVYLLAVMRALADGVATPRMRISSDELLWDAPLTLASIANGRWVGGMFLIAPAADHADGELDLTIAGPVTRRRVLRLLPKLTQGTHVDEPEIRHWQVRQLDIEADAPVASHLDGEVQPLGRHFSIEILPGALRLI